MPGIRLHHEADANSRVTFYINGKEHSVHGDYDVETSLVDYIRDVAGLRGTKVMCREGGCGCCAVTVTRQDLITKLPETFSINSCLCPLYSVDGWQITTVEGIGSRKEGYHPIQDRLASYNGSQCGYCSPGVVMNMYGFLHKKPTPSQQEVEDQLDGNLCRCTGYRPILDAMRSFSADPTVSGTQCIDIEDLNKKLCPRTGMPCGSEGGLQITAGGQSWFRPESLKAMAGLVMSNQGKKVRFVFGNTAAGVYKDDGPFDVFIDLHGIKDLYQITPTETSMQLGSNLTLAKLIEILEDKKTEKAYTYFGVVVKQLKRIGNVLLRNAGSWAGNVMMKHAHPEFPSDLVTVMEAVGAHVAVVDCSSGELKSYSLQSVMSELDMKNKLIVSLELFQKDDRCKLFCYKVMPRSQNAHAHVSAAFCWQIDSWKLKVLKRPSLVIGGISKDTMHAMKTEAFLDGKTLTDGVVLKTAMDFLASELEPSADDVMTSPQYRRRLAVHLLYKSILEICGAKNQFRVSGPSSIARPVSSAVHDYQDRKADWPLKEAMPKLEAHIQTSGEAVFINDMPSATNQLCGAFVLTSRGPATVQTVDPSLALRLPGVVDYISHNDIPDGGVNNYMSPVYIYEFTPEELFCSGGILYAGQPLGLILAESQAQADEAAKKVTVTYNDVKTPILTIEDAIEKESFHANPLNERRVGDPEDAMKKSAKTVSGRCNWGSNYHFYMENQVTLCVPSDDCMDVYSAIQASGMAQKAVSMVTGLPMNKVAVTVPRLGGSFGGKFSAALPAAAASAIAAHKHNRPVKVAVNMSTNMQMAGKRFPVMAKYDVGFDEAGRVHVVSIDIYCDGGSSANSMAVFGCMPDQIDGAYYIPNWKIRVIACKTDKPPNTMMRAPGPLPTGLFIESVMEHVSKYLSRSVVDVKELNLYKEGQMNITGQKLTYCNIRKLWTDLRKMADVDRRQNEVNSFNKANQWKKRGLTMTPVKYGIFQNGPGLTVDVSIYGGDGTITVSQGGVEVGQGLFTKVAQAVAMSLGVSVAMVRVLSNHSHISPNNMITGGSVTSQFAVLSAIKCCDILKDRMQAIREKYPDQAWPQLVESCLKADVELSAKHKQVPTPEGQGLFQYFTYSAAVTEVELDVLTGENQIRRVDILYDCGESLNPSLDIGQIEGGYVMGTGNLLLEDIVYHPETGAVLNHGTWDYNPPTAKDIPVDFRIKLLPDSPNVKGVKGSKGAGEPPTVLATGALYALKQAMEAARVELTGNKEFQPTVAPLTVERLMLGCGVHTEKLVL